MKKLLASLCGLLLLVCCAGVCCACGAPEEEPAADFIFMSDTQARPAAAYTAADYGDFAALLAAAREQSPQASLLLLGGDTVNDGADEAEWQAWHDAAGEELSGLTVLAAEGNHDRRSLVYDKFPPPAGAKLHRGSFWSWESGGVHFLVLDSSLMGAAEAQDVDWVEQDLAGSGCRIVVALMHHPAYPALDVAKDNERAAVMREHFVPLFEKYGVDLVLCGHQHVYMRTAPQNGVTYVMLSSGEKEYAGGAAPAYAEVLLEEPAYMTGHVNGERLELEVYDESGLLDRFSVE